jgi:GNAT superfamily N-acetyltransferase
MELRPFDAELAATVAAWPLSADEALMWCGQPAGTPLAWSAEEGVHPYGLFDGDALVAYGELWIDDDEEEVELARLIVDPARRGAGTGRALVAALTGRARETGRPIYMRVHPANAAALRCYASGGFVPVDPELAAEWNKPQPVPYVWLTAPEPGPRSA